MMSGTVYLRKKKVTVPGIEPRVIRSRRRLATNVATKHIQIVILFKNQYFFKIYHSKFHIHIDIILYNNHKSKNIPSTIVKQVQDALLFSDDIKV